MKRASKVLVADDDDRTIRLVEAILVPLGLAVIAAHDGQEAVEKAESCSPDVMLLDIMMPALNGFEVAKRLKRQPATRLIPIVMVTALREVRDRVKALEAGADDFLSKPIERTELKARVQSLLKVKTYNDHVKSHQRMLETEIAKRTNQLRKARDQQRKAYVDTIQRLARAAEYRDEDTGAHLNRMSEYAALVAQKIGLRQQLIDVIRIAAPMHDLGKIGIPDRILLKPGPLSRVEFEIMKRHTIIGAEILRGSKVYAVRQGAIIAATHHEKWDGSGYPRGLKGTKIPLIGRMTALADVFDALTSRRPYKPPLAPEEAFDIIAEGRAKSFDPELTEGFLSASESVLRIKARYENDHYRPSSLWMMR